jgi:hypothetical protein
MQKRVSDEDVEDNRRSYRQEKRSRHNKAIVENALRPLQLPPENKADMAV